MTRPPGRTRPGLRVLMYAVQGALIAAVLWLAARALAGQWDAVRASAGAVRPRWGLALASCALVLATYALLIESWRSLVRAWGDRLAFGDAARIWFVSNLGKYLPGKLWSIGAMGVLAQRAGVSPVAAAGSSVVGTLANIAAGFVVLFVLGAEVARDLFPGLGRAAAVLPVLGVVGLCALPIALPYAARLAARLLRRDAPRVRVPARVLALVVAVNVASWVLYGTAFHWLVLALVPGSGGKWDQYVAVFAGSYLAGYLALIIPGGLGVRELSMAGALVRLGLADAPTAALLAVVSRFWLTVLELVPGLLFLARGVARRVTAPRSDASV